MRKSLLTLMSVAVFALAACSPAAQPTPTPKPTDALTEEIAPTDEVAVTEEAAAMTGEYAGPAWTNLEVVNARTGETFKLADFAGKTVFVEPMATWCSNCRRQLGNVKAAREQLTTDDVVFVSFSVAENVDHATLAAYADQQGWEWVFAVATPELTQALVDTFTRSVITPPSTPHFIIAPDGTVSDLVTGFHDPAVLIQELDAVKS